MTSGQFKILRSRLDKIIELLESKPDTRPQYDEWITCPACNDNPYINNGATICYNCHGEGRVKREAG